MELVETLLDHGAEMEIKNDDGDTPLMLAVRSDHSAVVDALCKRGCNMRAHGFDNVDPIEYAMNKRNLFLSDVLMKHERQQINSAGSMPVDNNNNSNNNTNNNSSPLSSTNSQTSSIKTTANNQHLTSIDENKNENDDQVPRLPLLDSDSNKRNSLTSMLHQQQEEHQKLEQHKLQEQQQQQQPQSPNDSVFHSD